MSWRPALILSMVALMVVSSMSAADDRPLIDPDVREGTRAGTVRVLVELRVPVADPAVIATAQDEALRRLVGTGTRLARRYSAAPLLALEIDAAALARLEEMRGLVARVRADRIVPPNEGPAPRR